ncbi:patatin [Cellulosimicrobium funkei]|nr:patatin [Cellulosimicrobium funkei]
MPGGWQPYGLHGGALSRLLTPEVLEDHEIVGLSGTSGGAICAAIAWTTLLERTPDQAGGLLHSFWEANSARSWPDQVLNAMVLWGGRMAESVAVPAVSPYLNTGATWASNQLARLVDQTVDLRAAQESASASLDSPLLLLGAVDVVNGRFRTFDSRDGEISTEAILASAAIPTLFRSVRVGGNVYWDGLFSQNPPVNALRECAPDEIWVIQINPSRIEDEPTQIGDITTRRNELAGNLSLYQELGFLEQIADWLADGTIQPGAVRHTTVRILEMNRTESTSQWGYTSKLNRDPGFIDELMELGEVQAQRMVDAIRFERAWDDDDLWPLVERFDPHTTVVSTHPLAPLEPTDDPERIHAFLRDYGLRVETARKRVCKDHVSWTVRSVRDPRIRARVSATFHDGRVTRFAVSES